MKTSNFWFENRKFLFWKPQILSRKPQIFVVKSANFGVKTANFWVKIANFNLKTANLILKTANFCSKTANFWPKTANFFGWKPQIWHFLFLSQSLFSKTQKYMFWVTSKSCHVFLTFFKYIVFLSLFMRHKIFTLF